MPVAIRFARIFSAFHAKLGKQARLAGLAAMLAVGSASSLMAASGTWIGTTSPGLWSNTANWSGGTIANGAGDTATFNTNITSNFTVSLDSSRTIGNLHFSDADTSTAANWLLTNNVLTLSGGTPTITVGAMGAGANANISSQLAGTAFTKSGAGTLVLSRGGGNGSSLSGTIAVNEGTLRLNAGGLTLPTAGYFTGAQAYTVASGATLDIAVDWNAVYTNTYNVSGTLNSVNLNYINNVTLNGGTITGSLRTGFNSAPSFTVTGSTASTISSSIQFVDDGASSTVVYSATFNVADVTSSSAADLTISGIISELTDSVNFMGMRLIKTGAGTLVLSNNANSWKGGISFNGGVVEVNTLVGGNTNSPLGAALGTAGFMSFDGGTLRYTGASVSGINRAFTINAGGATIDVANAAATVAWTAASGAGPITGAGSLTKTGAGTLTLQSANSFLGGVVLNAGVLTLENNAALGTGTFTLSGGSVRSTGIRLLTNNIVATDSTSTNIINAGTGDIVYNANNVGTLTGSGTLVVNSNVSRSLWLQGNASGFTGQIQYTNVNDGTNFRFGGSNTTSNSLTNGSNFSGATLVLAGSVDNNRGISWNGLAGATVQIGALSGVGRIGFGGSIANWQIGAANLDTTYSGTIEGTGAALTKVGTGSLTLSGTYAYTGITTVSAGKLLVNGTHNSAGDYSVWSGATLGGSGIINGTSTITGILSPGNSVGTLTFGGNQVWASGMTYLLEVNNATGTAGGPSGWDLEVITTGTLNLTAGSYTIDLDSLLGSSPGAALNWNPFSDYTWEFARTSDLSGIVGFDAGLFTVDASGFTLYNPIVFPHGTGAFTVTSNGQSLFLNYTAAVPEPSSLGLTALGLLALVRFKRKRNG